VYSGALEAVPRAVLQFVPEVAPKVVLVVLKAAPKVVPQVALEVGRDLADRPWVARPYLVLDQEGTGLAVDAMRRHSRPSCQVFFCDPSR
jgi:hypothetical protein